MNQIWETSTSTRNINQDNANKAFSTSGKTIHVGIARPSNFSDITVEASASSVVLNTSLKTTTSGGVAEECLFRIVVLKSY
jgi:hypothetical protein